MNSESRLENGTIWLGDNLAIMCSMDSGIADLVYLDPPFNSNMDYTATSGYESSGYGFGDKWNSSNLDSSLLKTIQSDHPILHNMIQTAGDIHSEGMKAYLAYMIPRIAEIHRLMKPTGSIYFHCDPTSSHYLKLILDQIFGIKNFLNEIVWTYRTGGGSKKHFRRKHDIIFLYAKNSGKHTFNVLKERSYSEYGRINFKGIKNYKDEKGLWYTLTSARDVWAINAVGRTAKERVGYPTQKPIKLLERIVEVSSNEGDVVLDPFCGSGTTCVVAERLSRQWIGIDISSEATTLALSRLAEEQELGKQNFSQKIFE